MPVLAASMEKIKVQRPDRVCEHIGMDRKTLDTPILHPNREEYLGQSRTPYFQLTCIIRLKAA